MKNIILTFGLIASTSLFSLQTFAGNKPTNSEIKHTETYVHPNQTAQPIFTDVKFNTAFTVYLQLKDALIAGDQTQSAKHATQLVTLFRDAGLKQQSLQANTISRAKSIDAMRETFISMNDDLTTLVKKKSIKSGKVYIAYCPMANDNNGAYWLSAEKAIRNPYFGSKMMRCGEVKEEISAR